MIDPSPLQAVEDNGGADIRAEAWGEPHAGADGYGSKEAAACGDPTQEVAGAATHGGPTLK